MKPEVIANILGCTVEEEQPFIVSGTEARVIQMIAERQMRGISKYGTTVAKNPLTLREWLQHQLEELLDAAVYCQRAIEELDAKADDLK
jgi:succinyl-CoA synthetase alpha subunit